MDNLYESIFKRKSVRKYDKSLNISDDELNRIKDKTKALIPLFDDIDFRFDIVKRSDTSAKFGEYCLLFYSEKKTSYLLNAGFLLEQMDLYFALNNIGSCFYGLAKPKEYKKNGLDYVIMISFGKSSNDVFRKNMSEFKRKTLDVICDGDFYSDIIGAVRLAPSACNTQPWRFTVNKNHIEVFRYTKIKSFIPKSKLSYFNEIDIGISLCFLEIALLKHKISFKREILHHASVYNDMIKIADYILK